MAAGSFREFITITRTNESNRRIMSHFDIILTRVKPLCSFETLCRDNAQAKDQLRKSQEPVQLLPQ